jgi:alkylresorcinol/alkylpyrone synthase
MATVAGLGEGFPDQRYSQEEILGALAMIWPGSPEEFARTRRIHLRAGVEGRYLALPIESYLKRYTWGESNRTWSRVGEVIGEKALRAAIASSGVAPSEIDALVFVTVTGLSTPSLDARMVERVGLSPNVKRIPIFGLGCVAGASALARCGDLARSHPGGAVALLSVELCSLTFQVDDRSGANVVATAIFGDGAAAAVVTGRERSATGPRIVGARSILYPDTGNLMGWEISEEGFKLVLSPEIPALIGKQLPRDVDAFLGDHGLRRDDVKAWIAHTGGPRIFSAIREALDLPDGALQITRDQLAATGNVSSASVLLVLKRLMDTQPPPPGSHGLMLAMGPGFCSELVLLQW